MMSIVLWRSTTQSLKRLSTHKIPAQHTYRKKPICNSPAAKRCPRYTKEITTLLHFSQLCLIHTIPTGSHWHKSTELAHSFLFCSCICLCLYGPFNCISFHKFSQTLSVFSLCSSGITSVLLVLSTIYLFTKVSFSPDIIPSGWLGSKHQLFT